MRRPWRHPVEPDRITVGELVAHGLDRHPEAVGIVWADNDVLVCRRHATDPDVLRIVVQLRADTDVAVVVVDQGRPQPRSCVHCVTVDGYRRDVERLRQRRR